MKLQKKNSGGSRGGSLPPSLPPYFSKNREKGPKTAKGPKNCVKSGPLSYPQGLDPPLKL